MALSRLKRTLVYCTRDAARRQNITLFSLSWEHVRQVTRIFHTSVTVLGWPQKQQEHWFGSFRKMLATRQIHKWRIREYRGWLYLHGAWQIPDALCSSPPPSIQHLRMGCLAQHGPPSPILHHRCLSWVGGWISLAWPALEEGWRSPALPPFPLPLLSHCTGGLPGEPDPHVHKGGGVTRAGSHLWLLQAQCCTNTWGRPPGSLGEPVLTRSLFIPHKGSK